jgi:hypothetical protein
MTDQTENPDSVHGAENWRWETFKNCLVCALPVAIVASLVILLVDVVL